MSPNINSFVGDLVAMAQAMEELPKANDRIADLERQLAEAQRHNQGLEQNIIGYKADIDGLNQRLADTSKAKDDIELKLMEMEDRQNAVSRFLNSVSSDANSLWDALNPKPAPTPEPVAETPVPNEPSTDAVHVPVDATTQYPEPISGDSNSHSDTSSVGHPFEGNGGGMSQPSSPQTPSINPASVKYSGLNYYDYPHWVSREDWKAGGGTDYSYDYRPF